MDVCESRKHKAAGSPRNPLVPAERNRNNAAAATTRRSATREVSSRYKSPIRSTPSIPRRSPSPSTRTLPATPKEAPKRSLSAERKRPSTPPSPRTPSTPVSQSTVDVNFPSRRPSTGSRLQESLWPSTMRSLNASFQSDVISVPLSKKEKPASAVSSDRTLRPSSNVAHRQAERPTGLRKPTPERKRSPPRGKNGQDQSENAKPVDGLHTRLIDQHRWPSKIGGKLSSNQLNKSVDLADKTVRGLSAPVAFGSCSPKRMPSSGSMSLKPLRKSSSDAARLTLLEDIGRGGSCSNSVRDNSPRVSAAQKRGSTNVSDRMSSPATRAQLSPTTMLRPASPSRTSASREVSVARSRPSTPPRGVSPSRLRSSNVSSQMNTSASVLSFIADFRKGKKATNYVEDAHQLRLLHNRHLQWQYVNACAEDVLYIQKATAEKNLYNVLNSMLILWDSVVGKRIILYQLNLELKLNAVLNSQIAYLDDWALLERDHTDSLCGAVEDLEASTLRLPVAGGSMADLESLKVAISSAVHVMHSIEPSICCLRSKMEGMNILVSELAVVAEKEKAMVDQCEALLASSAIMQIEERSIMTHLIQMKKALEKQPISAMKTPTWNDQLLT